MVCEASIVPGFEGGGITRTLEVHNPGGVCDHYPQPVGTRPCPLARTVLPLMVCTLLDSPPLPPHLRWPNMASFLRLLKWHVPCF